MSVRKSFSIRINTYPKTINNCARSMSNCPGQLWGVRSRCVAKLNQAQSTSISASALQTSVQFYLLVCGCKTRCQLNSGCMQIVSDRLAVSHKTDKWRGWVAQTWAMALTSALLIDFGTFWVQFISRAVSTRTGLGSLSDNKTRKADCTDSRLEMLAPGTCAG